jgi:uncharacterized protein (TIGR00645 family)
MVEYVAPPTKIIHTTLEFAILFSRWLLMPFYVVLVWMMFLLAGDFILAALPSGSAEVLTRHLIMTLEMLDYTMVANLVWFILAGSYYVFVYPNPRPADWPEWFQPRALRHISSGLLKEKMAGSLVGVSSVHLLQVFLSVYDHPDPEATTKVGLMIAIHMAFIIGLLAFNYANKSREDTNVH